MYTHIEGEVGVYDMIFLTAINSKVNFLYGRCLVPTATAIQTSFREPAE
jgi:hypothetical protein